MNQRTRKLIGTIILLFFVPIYALVAMTIAAARLPGTSGLEQSVFFLIAGLLWIIPAGVVIRWMQRPEPDGKTGNRV